MCIRKTKNLFICPENGRAEEKRCIRNTYRHLAEGIWRIGYRKWLSPIKKSFAKRNKTNLYIFYESPKKLHSRNFDRVETLLKISHKCDLYLFGKRLFNFIVLDWKLKLRSFNHYLLVLVGKTIKPELARMILI